MAQRFAKERLGGSHVSRPAQVRFNRFPATVDGTIKIDPTTTKIDIRLVRPPRSVHRSFERTPPLLEQNRIMDDPSEDRTGGDCDTQLAGNLGQVTVAELEAQIPPNRERNEFICETSAAEER